MDQKYKIEELLSKLDDEIKQVKLDPQSLTLSSTANTNALFNYVSLSDPNELENLRIKLIGKKGSIATSLSDLGKQPVEKRKEIAGQINPVKETLEHKIIERKQTLDAGALDARLNTENVDVTLPVREAPAETGRVH